MTEQRGAGAFSYTVIRYVSDQIRDEAVNIGVIVVDPSTGKTAHRFMDDLRPLEARCPGANIRMLEDVVKSMEITDMPNGAGDLERLAETQTRTLQYTPPRAVMDDTLYGAMRTVYGKYVMDAPELAAEALKAAKAPPSSARVENIVFRAMDGTALHGTFRSVLGVRAGALLVHGLTGDRDEGGGFYRTLANRLGSIGVDTLRYDMRAHGQSGGRELDVTLSSTINDIESAHGALRNRLPTGAPTFVVAASFAGGLAAYWAAERPEWSESTSRIKGVALFNPLFEYDKRFVYGRADWHDGALTDAGMDEMAGRGWLVHGGEFRMGAALFNEVLRIRPQHRVASLCVPPLTVHGGADSVAPFDVSMLWTTMAARNKFVAIRGADHGFVHPEEGCGGGSGNSDVRRCGHPDTERFRGQAIDAVVGWMRDLICAGNISGGNSGDRGGGCDRPSAGVDGARSGSAGSGSGDDGDVAHAVQDAPQRPQSTRTP